MRRVYREFLGGMNPREIAKGLEDDGIEGCMGQKKWYASTVLGILKNEKHMGNALLDEDDAGGVKLSLFFVSFKDLTPSDISVSLSNISPTA